MAFVVLKQGVQTIQEAAIQKYLIQCPQTVVGSKVMDILVTIEVSTFWCVIFMLSFTDSI